MANQFLLSSIGEHQILLSVGDNPTTFESVEKSVAYNNFAAFLVHYSDPMECPNEISALRLSSPSVKLKDPDNKGKTYKRTVRFLDSEKDDKISWKGELELDADAVDMHQLAFRDDVSCRGDCIVIPYEITGWIGVHATIDRAVAEQNDKRFYKDKFVNPLQIRLYVRNKLAVENIIGYLGISKAFLNYIEGELSFNILDDDLLKDIATSNRQGYDELDKRWQELIVHVKPMVELLISYREKLGEEIKTEARQERVEQAGRAKAKAIKNFRKELEELPRDSRDIDIIVSYAQQFAGSLKGKERYRVFLSHSRRSRCFSDFVYYLLLKRGVCKEELFYTSADEDSSQYADLRPLEQQIKEALIDTNVLVVYFVFPGFRESDYCMFEAGAGWATKSVNDVQILADSFASIPAYLSNNKKEKCLDGSIGYIDLNKGNYTKIVTLLNAMIEHLNIGREILGQNRISLFEEAVFPDNVQLKNSGSKESDYMDPLICEYWEEYLSKEKQQAMLTFDRGNKDNKGE